MVRLDLILVRVALLMLTLQTVMTGKSDGSTGVLVEFTSIWRLCSGLARIGEAPLVCFRRLLQYLHVVSKVFGQGPAEDVSDRGAAEQQDENPYDSGREHD